MPRFKYSMTSAKITSFRRERRGEGEGASYRPWLTVQDVPSRGRSHRLSCLKTGGRTMHFLSDHEYVAFLEAWWDTTVNDIREQFPLNLRRTLTIAGQIEVRHPVDPHTGILLPQTTDLVLTIGKGDDAVIKAWAVKDIAELTNPRSMEKLEIERLYWSQLDIRWHLIVNEGLNTFRARNLDWLYKSELAIRGGLRANADCVTRVLALVRQCHSETAGPACRHMDQQWGTRSGEHVAALRLLFLTRMLTGDMAANALVRQPLSSFRVAQ